MLFCRCSVLHGKHTWVNAVTLPWSKEHYVCAFWGRRIRYTGHGPFVKEYSLGDYWLLVTEKYALACTSDFPHFFVFLFSLNGLMKVGRVASTFARPRSNVMTDSLRDTFETFTKQLIKAVKQHSSLRIFRLADRSWCEANKQTKKENNGFSPVRRDSISDTRRDPKWCYFAWQGVLRSELLCSLQRLRSQYVSRKIWSRGSWPVHSRTRGISRMALGPRVAERKRVKNTYCRTFFKN